MIVSHDKNSLDSIAIEDTKTLFDIGSEYDVVGIDEAQFFSDDLLTTCKDLAKNKTRVIIAGLDTDYKGLPFGPMPLIMCESDYLDKLTAICMQCGKDATYTQRITKQTQQVVNIVSLSFQIIAHLVTMPPKSDYWKCFVVQGVLAVCQLSGCPKGRHQ